MDWKTLKLNTFDFYIASYSTHERDYFDSYPSDTDNYGPYCNSSDAIDLINQLQHRIAELEAEKG